MRGGPFGAAVLAAAVLALSAARAQEPPPSPTPQPVPSAPAPVPTPAAPGVEAPAVPPSDAPAVVPAAPAGPDVIVGFRVVGYQTVSPDTIAHYLGIKVGDKYDPEKVRQNFAALWDTGLLENAKIEAEPSSAGVTLVVTV